jgi:hypothetical protein
MKAFPALAGLLGLAIAGVFGLAAKGVSHAAEPRLTSAQSDYLEQCGGCHGLQGDSAPSPIPVLRDRVGYFMCTEAGREYLGRLPNIAYAKIDDDSLAEMLNFVVFGLGEGTAPAGARPFTAVEVARLRAQPMTGSTVEKTRKTVVETLIRNCKAPASLRQPYAVQGAALNR